MNKLQHKIKLSVVISVFNEEKMLPASLESVVWADEIIIVDNSSTDNTVQIARKYTDRIFPRENNLMLNINKNYGFSKAKHEWILSLDADERVSVELKEEILRVITKSDNSISGYWIPRKNIIFGKWIQNSIWWPDEQLRLFRKGKGEFPEKHVHEKLVVENNSGRLENPLDHHNYETVSQYIYKMDKIYSESEVKNILESEKKLAWYDALKMPVSDFLKTFFLQKGYKDGLHGLVLSLLQAFYAEVVFAKVWERQGFPEYNNDRFLHDVLHEFKKNANEFHYWILTTLINNAKNKIQKVYYKLLRRKVSFLIRGH